MKIIKIDDCIDCPLSEFNNKEKSWLCTYSITKIFISYVREFKITPKWCPLEDCKEADHETPA